MEQSISPPFTQVAAHRQAPARAAGHLRWTRLTHAIVALSVLTLAFSGFVILMAHPRLYWGEVGNDLTPALLELPISRNYRHAGWEKPVPYFQKAGSPVSAVRTYDIFNQNGWARSLHFLAAWCFVAAGLAYLSFALITGHLRRQLMPRAGELTARHLREDLMHHLRFEIAPAKGGPPYGLLQKLNYSVMVLIVLPLIVITGLGMSPAINAAFPWLSGMFGGSQSSRTLHFCLFASIVVFILIHVLMVVMSGF